MKAYLLVWRSSSALVLLLAWLCAATAEEEAPARSEGLSLTIYNARRQGAYPSPYNWQFKQQLGVQGYGSTHRSPSGGWAVVKMRRRVELPKGLGKVRVTDVAASLIPASVFCESLTDPKGTTVLEQNFLYDLANAQTLLKRFIGHEISLMPQKGHGLLTGRLLSPQGLLLHLEGSPEPVRLASYRELRLPRLPGGLLTRPTLVWQVKSDQAGKQLLEITYLCDHITWRSDYILHLSEDEKTLELSGWATITNNSGATYPQARLKLMGGDVQKLADPPLAANAFAARRREQVAQQDDLSQVHFTEKSFFEYHLYTLGRPSDVADRSTKQIELFPPAQGVPCRKILVYEGGRGIYMAARSAPLSQRNFGTMTNTKVDVYVEFKNEEQAHLGMPLPAGRIRVYRNDPNDGAAEFIGEDEIDHTPKDEAVRIRLGESFDVTGERKQTAFNANHNEHRITESFEIRLRNHKDKPEPVVLQEKLYRWVNWKLTAQNHDFKKINADTIRFQVQVPANGEKVVTYTVRYDW